jgi:hypothetical protein
MLCSTAAVMVTFTVVVTDPCDAVMVAVPEARPCRSPEELTLATAEFELA